MMFVQKLSERDTKTGRILCLEIQQHVPYLSVDFHFNADPVALKLLTHEQIKFGAGV